MHVIGDVSGKDTIILDDMIDTAGTTTQAAQALVDSGARRVMAACTHAVLSGPAIDRINASPLEKVIATDTLPLGEKLKICSKLQVQSVSTILGEAIKRIHDESSVSSLFL